MRDFKNVCAPWYKDLWLGCEEMPSGSKVIMTSMVACGGSFADIEAILGANVVVNKLEIKRGCHVTVMESGKLLLL